MGYWIMITAEEHLKQEIKDREWKIELNEKMRDGCQRELDEKIRNIEKYKEEIENFKKAIDVLENNSKPKFTLPDNIFDEMDEL